MSISVRTYMVSVNGNLMRGRISASNGYDPVDPDDVIHYFNSKLDSNFIVMSRAENFPNCDEPMCNIYVSIINSVIEIEITDWTTSEKIYKQKYNIVKST